MVHLPTDNAHDFHAELSHRWHELNSLLNSPKPSVQSQSAQKYNNTGNKSIHPASRLSVPQFNVQPRRKSDLTSLKPKPSAPLSHNNNNNNIYNDIALQQQKQIELLQWKQQHKQHKLQQYAAEQQRIKQFKHNISSVKSHLHKNIQSRHSLPNTSNPQPHSNNNSNQHNDINNIIVTPPAKQSINKTHHTSSNNAPHIKPHSHNKSINKLNKSHITTPVLSPAAVSSADAIRRDRKSRTNQINKPEFEIVIKSDHNENQHLSNSCIDGSVLDKTIVKTSLDTNNTKSDTAINNTTTPSVEPSSMSSSSNAARNTNDNINRLKSQIESTKSLVIEWIGANMFDKLYTHIKSLKPIDLNAPINLQLVVHEPIHDLLQPNQQKVLRHVQKLVIVENLLNKQKSK